MIPWTRHRSRSASVSSASSRRCASAISSERARAHDGAPEQPGVAAAYDRWAATYDTDRNPTRDLDATVVRDADLPLAGAAVLELGCGTGKNTAWLAGRAARIVAMDFSAGMLARARERVRGAHVDFVQADVRAPWPLPDAAVDIVIGNLVLEHVESLPPVFAEAARVLRPGGVLFLCELHPFRQWRGGQAHFTDDATGETIRVAAHVHAVSEYVDAGLRAGLTLHGMGEWLEPAAEPGALPRLLSLRFAR